MSSSWDAHLASFIAGFEDPEVPIYGGIVSQQGAVCGWHGENRCTKDEAVFIVQLCNEVQSEIEKACQNGVRIGGEKFMFLKNIPGQNEICCKIETKIAVAKLTKTLVLIAVADDEKHKGKCSKGVGKYCDILTGVNY